MKTDYSQSEFKIKARAENIRLYRELTGNQRLPPSKEYWTLCNLQPQDEGSEIVQLVKAGMLDKRQFVGVDLDPSIIAQNRVWHPQARWYAGEWTKVLRSQPFNPSMVYLDTTSFADHSNAIRLLVVTMLNCPDDTVVFANLMMNDPRSRRKFKIDTLIDALKNEIPSRELAKWDSRVLNYEYSMTGLTDMGTFVLVKG